MNVWVILAVGAALFLGWGVATLQHDVDRHRWQIAWLIGRTGRQETRIRRLEALAGVTAGDEDSDPPTAPSWPTKIAARVRGAWSAVRAAGTWLSSRADPQPLPVEQPSPEPRTEPIARAGRHRAAPDDSSDSRGRRP